ncbi:MAG: acyl-CoA dehydratase activase-related protein [Tissierellaceae bacterium]|nr:acyl-CoA dehydratase activase-related protein [Tissierellaceae bacterium]
MIIGIPKGLLYYDYYPFFESFFQGLGANTVTSEDTNKTILDEGIKHCVDEACLPVKVFHGHVASLRGKSDLILIPRIMQISQGEYICPKFCGLPEMVKNSIPDLPTTIDQPIYAASRKELFNWAKDSGGLMGASQKMIRSSFDEALEIQSRHNPGIKDENFKYTIALGGHPYNIYDKFINMNIIEKLNQMDVGILTEERVGEEIKNEEVKFLYKKPFWTFARNSFGFLSYVSKEKNVDGIIYISSFACGIDSVIIELVKERIGNMPFMVLKVDEHTGEAGLDTRIEAFIDMIWRR